MLFAGAIKENIKYGKISATDEEVIDAARAAHVLNFTDHLPNGLDTQVGHRGSSQLSGGQKQRVAIARILLKDPPIVILDEATSALDAKSEYHINEAIKSMSRGRTVISIAHRMSTIKEADRIAVLKDGKVAEIGSFHELIQSQGAFYNLMEQQLNID
jgi:ABC-type multidrug transport system fused ATPase/permease subunit